jgi:uncharacterized membrane protein
MNLCNLKIKKKLDFLKNIMSICHFGTHGFQFSTLSLWNMCSIEIQSVWTVIYSFFYTTVTNRERSCACYKTDVLQKTLISFVLLLIALPSCHPVWWSVRNSFSFSLISLFIAFTERFSGWLKASFRKLLCRSVFSSERIVCSFAFERQLGRVQG